MKLFSRKYGSGKPLVILHGLFGQSDNWNTLAKKFGESGFEVYTLDLRNHGLSPHSDKWNYTVMAEDLNEFIMEHHLQKPNLIGHSMGGKTVMFFELLFPSVSGKIVVADIAPRAYPPHNKNVLTALLSIDLDKISSRKEAEDGLNQHNLDFGTKQFLLKNLYWENDAEGRPKNLAWRFNLKAIAENFGAVGEKIPEGKSPAPALFLRGEKSDYVLPTDENAIKLQFPNAEIRTVEGAGHWIHAEKPIEFFNECVHFLNK
jgi:esterase